MYTDRITKINNNLKDFLDENNIKYTMQAGVVTVGGSLHLNRLTSIPEGFNPTVGGDLWLDRLTSIPKGFNPTVGGYLDLRGLTSIPEGFNPTVGGSLWLNRLTSIPEGFNPTVGGSLDLSGLTSIPEGFNPTVGGDLHLSGLSFNKRKIDNIEQFLVWQNGRYRKIDGMFCEIIKEKKHIITVKIRNKIAYIFRKNNINAHGKTIKSAYRDWLFKTSPRDMQKYEDIKLSDINSLDFWVVCYRQITGACSFGTENFLESQTQLKKEYSLKEIFGITKNQYGHNTFINFFKKERADVYG